MLYTSTKSCFNSQCSEQYSYMLVHRDYDSHNISTSLYSSINNTFQLERFLLPTIVDVQYWPQQTNVRHQNLDGNGAIPHSDQDRNN